MKLKTKLYVGFGTIFLILLIISTIVFYTLSNQKSNLEGIVQNDYQRVILVQNLKFNLQSKASLIREYFINELDKAPLIDESEIVTLNEVSRKIFNDLHILVSKDPQMKDLISELQQLNNIHTKNIEIAIEDVKVGDYEEARDLTLVKNAEIRNTLLNEIDRLTKIEEQKMSKVLDDSIETYQSTLVLLMVLLTISFLIVIGITASVIRSFTKNLNSVRNVMTKIPKHSFEKIPRIEVKMNNEFGDLAKAYNEMAVALEHFAINEKELNKSLTDENWVKTKYGELATSFQGARKLNVFSTIFISKIAQTVDATYGLFYFKDDKGFKKTASYAANQEELGEIIILEGEGLVGQCALNNEAIQLDNLPHGYIKTKSGLGGATPTSLIILPLEFEGEVLGVLELAKFEQFTPLQRRLLEQVCNSIGPNLDRIQYHMKIESLLSESQVLTEELQAQSEELQQQQEELKTINEDLHKENIRSEEKTKELELIKSDLEQKNREIMLSSKYKTEFLANMSHELRTPLNSMLILSEILSENSGRNLTKKQIEYANTIHTSGKDLLNLINDILDLSKVESGKLDLYPEEVEIEEIKAFVERQFTPIARKKDLNFKFVIDDNTPEVIITDDQRLKQILKNLLSNAFKFTNKGEVTLKITAGDLKTNSTIIFMVMDTGIGIPKNKQQSIFEAFSQVDGTTSRKYGGTGLGLSISRELAQLLGGFIEVSSEEGKGSIFSLHLLDCVDEKVQTDSKFVAAAVEAQTLLEEVSLTEVPVEENKNLENETIEVYGDIRELKDINVLIVDDDMRNVFALTSALEMERMNVLYAENGIEAISILDENKVDIVLMDIMMPKMDGYKAMEEIRKKETLKDIPIIALTAKAMKTDRQKCIDAGASDYISKPVKIEQLLSLIKVWLYK